MAQYFLKIDPATDVVYWHSPTTPDDRLMISSTDALAWAPGAWDAILKIEATTDVPLWVGPPFP